MDNIPRGIEIEKMDNSSLTIRTLKRELVFSDYFGVFFVMWGFTLIAFALIQEGVSNSLIFVSSAISIMLLLLLTSLILTFKEYYIITITDKSIEIFKKQGIFSNKQILDKIAVEKVDFKEIKSQDVNLILNFRLLCNLGFYKIPRIVCNGQETLIFQNYKKNIRVWIVDYLNEMTK
jgi:hypothetical protein